MAKFDIRLRYGRWAGEKAIYFGIEAKKISNTGGERTTFYVDYGVERFVDGSYCAGLPTGMMLGYLLDGKGVAAHAKIDEVLQDRYGSAAALRVETPPQSAAAYGHSNAVRRKDGSVIELIHLAVDLPEAA